MRDGFRYNNLQESGSKLEKILFLINVITGKGEEFSWNHVYQIIGAILYEISFHGLPENRDKRYKDVLVDTEEMKEVMKGLKSEEDEEEVK